MQKFSCNSYKDLSIASVDKVLFTKNNSVILGTKVYRKNLLPIEKFGLEKAEKLLNFLQNDDVPINTLIRFTLKEAGTS